MLDVLYMDKNPCIVLVHESAFGIIANYIDLIMGISFLGENVALKVDVVWSEIIPTNFLPCEVIVHVCPVL